MNGQVEDDVESNRHYIKTLVEVISLCAREEIALRGHNESEGSDKPGHFRSIFELVAKHDSTIK